MIEDGVSLPTHARDLSENIVDVNDLLFNYTNSGL